MTPHYADDRVTLWHGDCRDVLRDLPDASVAAVVTDPPYELGFMGKSWDASGVAYDVAVWRECLRVLRPGGHLLAFGGTRTWHRLTVAIEDAGFEIRDSITWLYASGFPKSLDVSKAIDKAAGATREVIGTKFPGIANPGDVDRYTVGGSRAVEVDITAPATEAAQQWSGWGTALKPASEPIVVARKPLGGTVAACVLEHGTGALNIDGCRVAGDNPSIARRKGSTAHLSDRPAAETEAQGRIASRTTPERYAEDRAGELLGRWPANVVLTHAPDCGPDDTTPCVDGCPVADLDAQSGNRKAGGSLSGGEPSRPFKDAYGVMDERRVWDGYADEGGASRFFPSFRFEAKAPTSERPRVGDTAHPTVKPLDLMRWLVRLVTPPAGTVLDPFAGSGTTGEAAALEGFPCWLVEEAAEHLPLITQRLTKRADPITHLASKGEDLGLFDLLDGGAAS